MTSVEQTADRAPANPNDTPVCEACGQPMAAQSRPGRVKRFCNEACRSAARRGSKSACKDFRVDATTVPGGRDAGARQAPGFGAGRGGVEIPDFQPVAGSLGTTQSLRPPQVRVGVHKTVIDGSNDTVCPETWNSVAVDVPGDRVAGNERRSARYLLRQVLRDATTVDRCKACGRDIRGGAVLLKVREGIAHFSGVETCGRIWLCPVCSAKIRARRGDEIAEAIGRHIAGGGDAVFVTATLPHDQGDKLKASLEVLTQSWRFLTSGKYFQREKESYGVLGNIKAIEVTYGRNGWHPHIHAVFVLARPFTVMDWCTWGPALDGRWARGLQRNGWAMGKLGYRLRVDFISRSTSAQLASYVTKVQDGGGLGNEISRADLKRGRKSSRTPFRILADFGSDGLVSDLDLWHEFEDATAGKSALRWSRGLRGLLLPDVDERTDEEIAAEEIGGDDLAVLLPSTWYRICDLPGAESAVLDAVESDGFEGLIRVLLAYRIGLDGVMTPDEWSGVSGPVE